MALLKLSVSGGIGGTWPFEDHAQRSGLSCGSRVWGVVGRTPVFCRLFHRYLDLCEKKNGTRDLKGNRPLLPSPPSPPPFQHDLACLGGVWDRGKGDPQSI